MDKKGWVGVAVMIGVVAVGYLVGKMINNRIAAVQSVTGGA